MTLHVPVQVKLLSASASLGAPKYATGHSTAADLTACLDLTKNVELDDAGVPVLRIRPGEMRMVSSGIAVRPAPGYATKIAARSGLAYKNQITLQNGTALIDHDYSDGLGVLLRNEGMKTFEVRDGDRIAQLEVHELIQGVFTVVDELDPPAPIDGYSERAGGFGSSGVKGDSAYSAPGK